MTVRFPRTSEVNGSLVGYPVAGRITSRFGATDIAAHSKGHSGVDIACATGSPVAAPAAGVVANIFRVGDGSSMAATFGNCVILDHHGAYTIYAHLSSVLVKTEQLAALGTLLGRSGNTGLSTGPHLHWGMGDADNRYLQRGKGLLDPLDYCGEDDGADEFDEQDIERMKAYLRVPERFRKSGSLQVEVLPDEPGWDRVLKIRMKE